MESLVVWFWLYLVPFGFLLLDVVLFAFGGFGDCWCVGVLVVCCVGFGWLGFVILCGCCNMHLGVGGGFSDLALRGLVCCDLLAFYVENFGRGQSAVWFCLASSSGLVWVWVV